MSNKPFEVMNKSDYEKYAGNKYAAEKYGDSDGSLQRENEALRKKYKIYSDDYSYRDLQKQRAFGVNESDSSANSSLEAANRFKRYNDPYSEQKYNAYERLKNFSYNPEEDPAYRAIREQNEAEGKSAQDKAYSDYTGLSGGRNNSWATVAAEQVGQAYKKKLNDILPQLADAAYNRLLMELNVVNDNSDNAYNRAKDKYNLDMNEYKLNKAEADGIRKDALSRLEYDDSIKLAEQKEAREEQEFAADQKYNEARLEQIYTNIQKAKQDIEKNNIELKYLTENEQIKLRLGYLDISEAELIIKQRKEKLMK